MKRSLEDKEKELEEEEKRLKEKRQALQKEKHKEAVNGLIVEAHMGVSDEEKKRITERWKRCDEEYKKTKNLYKLEKSLREEIRMGWALRAKENPWRNITSIGDEDFPLCENEQDFYQCKHRVSELIDSGKGFIWFDDESFPTTPEGLAKFAHELYKECNMLTQEEEEYWIEKEQINVFLDPREDASEFYVCIRNPTKEDRETKIQLY